MAARTLALRNPDLRQWLNRPTPNIPRTADGQPDLTAPAPRAAEGHPDFSGNWQGRAIHFAAAEGSLTPAAQTLVRERKENYFRERPSFQCKPSGPEVIAGCLADDALYVNGLLGEPVRLIPHSDTFFMSTDGLTYTFGGDGTAISYVVERHVSGDWKYARQP